MLELGVGAHVVRAIGVTYWLAGLLLLTGALWWPKILRGKAIAAAVVVLTFGAMPLCEVGTMTYGKRLSLKPSRFACAA